MDDKVNALVENLLHSDEAVSELGVQSQYKRLAWAELNRYLDDFWNKDTNYWLLMPGLRGIGKTTLLAQLYDSIEQEDKLKKIFFSFEDLSSLQCEADDFFEAIRRLRHKFPDQSLIVLVDEVHFEPRWSQVCKKIYDRIPRTFLVCTGSSALSLRLNPDSARRVDVIDIHPLSLEEFASFWQISSSTSQLIEPDPKIRQDLSAVIFESANIEEVYAGLTSYEKLINSYYDKLQNTLGASSQHSSGQYFVDNLVNQYIYGYGSMPFSDKSSNPKGSLLFSDLMLLDDVYRLKRKISRSIDQTLLYDTFRLLAGSENNPRLNFDMRTSTINLLPKLVSILANSDQISLAKIAKNLGNVHQKTLQSMIIVMVASDLIVEVLPLGSSFAKSNKTPKYLFRSPALRQSLLAFNLDNVQDDGKDQRLLKGRMLEDTVIMHLKRIFNDFSGQIIEYDSESGGADFIVMPHGLVKKSIVVEVGLHKKSSQQVAKTLKKSGLYGVVLTNIDRPRLNIENETIYIPLSYFLLA